MERYLLGLGEEVEGKVKRMADSGVPEGEPLQKGVGGWEGYGKNGK